MGVRRRRGEVLGLELNRREREGDELGEGEEGDGGFQARPAAGISTGEGGQAGRGAEACTPLPSVASSWQEVEDAPALPCGLGQVGRRLGGR